MKLYDTLRGEKQILKPENGEVKLYVCGINPYAPAHVGHALCYITFDVLRRYLEFQGYKVHHVQNFTDVEDNIIDAARRADIPIQELVDRYIAEFLEDMDALNIQRAHTYPRATQEIPKMLDIIKSLVDQGYAYAVEGNVYFRVTEFTDYGKLSHRTLDGMLAGARVEIAPGKDHPMDFVLWKAAKPDEPSWDSPWGRGRPGWHIECSAMSLRYLGSKVDIHGGGLDLIFPHHENEIAQTEAYTGQVPFVAFWLHNGLLRLDEAKMSKSLGNLVTVRDAIARSSGDALRLYLLSSHYRTSPTYSDAGLAAQKRAVDRLVQAVEIPEHSDFDGDALDATPFSEQFSLAMDDDLNTPQALATMFDLTREINSSKTLGIDVTGAQNSLRKMAGVLGLTLEVPRLGNMDIEPYLEILADLRNELRAAHQYEIADKVRDRLRELGVNLEDRSQGTRWNIQKPVS
jgi:cysteinyl-tRNA synthetase